jgi:hypothetical protein
MVLRFWGERGVQPQDFASLVDTHARGIPTTALAAAVRTRGWRTTVDTAASGADLSTVRTVLQAGHPVIALVQVRANVYHYVVIVGIDAGHVIFHDPARAPNRLVRADLFLRDWSLAGRWMLTVLPDAAGTGHAAAASAAAPAPEAPGANRPSPCDAQVDRAVALARGGRTADAETALRQATATCPGDASAWRELAGLRFVQHRYGDAAELALRAVHLSEDDSNAWQVLATSRYLQGDLVGALAAWNQIDRPRLDTVSADGLVRTAHPIVVNRLGLTPRAVLTSDAFLRAARRLDELPVASSTALTYTPVGDDSVRVKAEVNESSVLPAGLIDWAVVAVRSAFLREARVDIAGLTGQGDRLAPAWRWSSNRPRVRVQFAIPSPSILPGTTDVEAYWERQSYLQPATGDVIREERVRGAVRVSDWARGWLRWSLGLATDRIDGRPFVAFRGGVTLAPAGDRVAVHLDGEQWASRIAAPGFGTASLSGAWRSTAASDAAQWIVTGGAARVSAATPLAEWLAAGSSNARGARLRGHTLFNDGVITTRQFGRELAFASVEYRRPVYHTTQGRVFAAGFVDMARTWERLDGSAAPLDIDVGGGARVGTPLDDSLIRVDLGYGLRDKRLKLSAGYVVAFGND